MQNQSWKKQFGIIYAGQAFSLLGSAAVQFAIIWWLTVQTESAITLTLSTIVSFLPNMLLGAFAGVWIDRYNRRTVMMLADGLVALSSLALGIAFLVTDVPPIRFVYVILFVRGIGNTFHGPALQAAIPMLVPPEMLTRAGGWGNLIVSISNIIGPALGAGMLTILPIASTMLVDILGAALAIPCLARITLPDLPPSAQKPQLFSEMRQGFAALLQNKPLAAIFPAMMLCNILYSPLASLFPLLVRTHFGGEAWHNGVVEAVFAFGLLASSLVIGVWGGMKRRFLMSSLFIAVLGVACAISGRLPESGYWPFVLCCFVMGTTGTFINVPLTAYTQETIAPQQMGKVFSMMMTAMTWAMPIGLLIAGPVSERFGVDAWFFWSGLALVLTGVLARVFTRKYDAQTMRRETGGVPPAA